MRDARIGSTGRSILITGGTDGLGRALGLRYAASGARVFVVGRAPDRLARAAEDGLFPVQADLSSAGGPQAVADALAAAGVERLDVLVHNAACAKVGPCDAIEPAAIEAMLATNLGAPIALTRLLSGLVLRARGTIVFIGSVAAFTPAARYAVYAATKAALDGFARSLARELHGRIRVQVIHPGPIRTGFHARSGADWLDTRRFPAPERVAARIERAIARGGWRAFADALTATVGVAGTLLRAPIDRVAAARESQTLAPSRDRVAPLGGSALPLAVVTGSAHGLGQALVRELLGKGFDVVGVDCDAGANRRGLRHPNLRVLDLDVRDPAAGDRLLRAIGPQVPIRLLIHCAGISDVGEFTARPVDRADEVVRTNLLAPVQLTSALLRARALCPGSSIVFVSSLSHYLGYPGAAVYAASKDGIAHFGRSLGVALAPRGIHCLTVFPGPMRTAHARRYAPAAAPEGHRVSPDVVARQVLRAVGSRRARLVAGRGAVMAMLLGIVAPTLATRLMGATLLQRLRAAPART